MSNKRVFIHVKDWSNFDGHMCGLSFVKSKVDVEDHPLVDRAIDGLKANFRNLEVVKYDPEELLANANRVLELASAQGKEVKAVSPMIVDGRIDHPNIGANGEYKTWEAPIVVHPKRAEAVAAVNARGYTTEAAEKIVDEHGADKILSDIAAEKAERESASQANMEASVTPPPVMVDATQENGVPAIGEPKLEANMEASVTPPPSEEEENEDVDEDEGEVQETVAVATKSKVGKKRKGNR